MLITPMVIGTWQQFCCRYGGFKKVQQPEMLALYQALIHETLADQAILEELFQYTEILEYQCARAEIEIVRLEERLLKKVDDYE